MLANGLSDSGLRFNLSRRDGLALIAVYEWYLAHLWLAHQVEQWQEFFAVKGRLSWIRLTREWLQYQLRLAAWPALASL